MTTETTFEVGDWADHKSGQLDPREVTRVEADGIYLDLGGSEIGPFPAENYENRGARHG